MAIKPGRKENRQLGMMHTKGARNQGPDEKNLPVNMRWWKLPDAQLPGALNAVVDHIRKMQTSFEQQRQICARLYGGMIPGSAFGISYDRLQTLHPSLSGRLTYNVMAIVIDTLQSKISGTPVGASFLTQGGDYRQQRRAKKLSQFSDGISYEANMEEVASDWFRDGALLNDGILKIYADPRTKRVVTERIIPSEIYVDEVDGLYDKPTQLHQAKSVDREYLLEAYGKTPAMRDAIEHAHVVSKEELGGSYQYLADSVALGESWHLPSSMGEDGKSPTEDGQHVIWINNCVLVREPWGKDHFPFARFRWKKAPYGWHGLSLAQDLIGSQVEMNHLLLMFQRAFRLMAAFRIAVEAGTIPDQHFIDKIGSILHVPKGSMMPQFLTPPALNAQYFEHFDRIKARAFEMARISALSAVGEKPAGLDSGEAQREYHDIESEGFQSVSKAFEKANMDVVRLQLDCVRDIFEDEHKYGLRAPVSSASLPGQRFLRSIDWKNVHLDEDEYIVRPWPVSTLPKTPAGRLATVQDLLKAGFIDQQTGMKLLEFPDLGAVQNLLGAAEDWITSCLDDIVENGKPRAPDGFMNLKMAEQMAIQEYSLGAANKMPDDKLKLLGSWITEVRRLQQKAAQAVAKQAQTGAMGAPGAVPGGGLAPGQGVPAPPPVSQLLPPAGTQPQA